MFLLTVVTAHAQQYAWNKVVHTGNKKWDKIEDIAVDNKNNFFVAAGFSDTLTLDKELYAHGASDALLFCTDSSGKYKWSHSMGYEQAEYMNKIVAIQNNLFVFVAVNKQSNDTSGLLSIIGICNDKGLILQKRQISGHGQFKVNSIAQDNNMLYVCGSFTGSICMNGKCAKAGSGQEGFILKLSEKLDIKWFRKTSSEQDKEFTYLHCLKDRLLVVGTSTLLDFSGVTEHASEQIFMQQYSLQGDSLTSKVLVQANDIRSTKTVLDNYNRLNISFSFVKEAVVFGESVNAVGAQDAMLITVSTQGNKYHYVHLQSEGITQIGDLAPTKDGVLLTGTFTKDLILPTNRINAHPLLYNTFLMQINSVGQLTESSVFQSEKEFYPRKLLSLKKERLLIAAAFKNELKLSSETLTAQGEEDIVLLTLAPCKEQTDIKTDTLEWTGTPLTIHADGGYKAYNWNLGECLQASYISQDTGRITLKLTEYNGCETTHYYIIEDVSDNQEVQQKSSDKYTDTLLEEDIVIYPIPATDEVSWSILNKNLANLDVELIDAQGKTYIIHNYKQYNAGTTYSLPVASLTPGIYYLRFYETGIIYSKEIIKQ